MWFTTFSGCHPAPSLYEYTHSCQCHKLTCFNRIIRLILLNSAQHPVTDDYNKLCKCVRDSRDVSSIVANTEVFLKLHGFIRVAELKMERERCKCRAYSKKCTFCFIKCTLKSECRGVSFTRRTWWLQFQCPVVWKAPYLVWNTSLMFQKHWRNPALYWHKSRTAHVELSSLVLGFTYCKSKSKHRPFRAKMQQRYIDFWLDPCIYTKIILFSMFLEVKTICHRWSFVCSKSIKLKVQDIIPLIFKKLQMQSFYFLPYKSKC